LAGATCMRDLVGSTQYPSQALLLTSIRVACHFLIDEPVDSSNRTELDLTTPMLIDLAKRLFEALETAFVCSAWLFKPQFRILQVVLIGSTLR